VLWFFPTVVFACAKLHNNSETRSFFALLFVFKICVANVITLYIASSVFDKVPALANTLIDMYNAALAFTKKEDLRYAIDHGHTAGPCMLCDGVWDVERHGTHQCPLCLTVAHLQCHDGLLQAHARKRKNKVTLHNKKNMAATHKQHLRQSRCLLCSYQCCAHHAIVSTTIDGGVHMHTAAYTVDGLPAILHCMVWLAMLWMIGHLCNLHFVIGITQNLRCMLATWITLP